MCHINICTSSTRVLVFEQGWSFSCEKVYSFQIFKQQGVGGFQRIKLQLKSIFKKRSRKKSFILKFNTFWRIWVCIFFKTWWNRKIINSLEGMKPVCQENKNITTLQFFLASFFGLTNITVNWMSKRATLKKYRINFMDCILTFQIPIYNFLLPDLVWSPT